MFVCLWPFPLPKTRKCLTLYPLKSLNWSLEAMLLSCPHTLLSVPSLLAFDAPFWPSPSPRECNLFSAGIDQTHKVLISTLYWITGASLHDWTQPFHCLVPLLAGEYFTSLELVIGFPSGSLLPFSAVKDPRVWFCLHLTECFRVGFVTWRQVKSWQQCVMDLMAVRYM